MSQAMAHKVIVPPKKIMSRSFLNSGTLIVKICASACLVIQYLYVEKTPRKFQFGKKSAKVYRSLYSLTEQLQVAL
jgi:hypothetical protein